jgi:ectoine hydroxylase-related dioxygenase (phytanoyl-CoA dioxygenase family)
MSQSQIKSQYKQHGYVMVRNVLDADLIKEAHAHIDWLLQKNPDLRPEQLDHHLMTKDAFWVRLVSDDRLLDIAQQFLGSDLALFASHYIAKRPYDGKAVPWHQDGSYWPLEPMAVITFWLAIDGSDEENGCMKVVPHTHTTTLLSTDDMVEQNGDSLFNMGMDAGGIDESQAVSMILNPGDISIHHPNIVHGSHANTSPRLRRGLTIRYMPTTTRILREPPHHSAFILRGQGIANGNDWQPLPAFHPATSMPFADQATWDKQCAAKNAANREFLPKI